MTNNLTDIEVDEISILSANVRPAVRRARIAIAKKESTMNEPISFASFEDACAYLAKTTGLSKSAAMSQAAREHPDLLAKYNQAGDEIAKAAAEKAINLEQVVGDAAAARQFWEIVGNSMRRSGLSRTAAMSQAGRDYPELRAAAFSEVPGTAAAPPVAKAVTAFNKLVDQVQDRTGCSRSAAMTKARQEFPSEFESYQNEAAP